MITKDTIDHVAQVARLSLTEEEKEKFLPELEEILHMFSQLQRVRTASILPAFHPIPISARMRDDEPKESLTREEAMQSTEHTEDEYFKGPKAL